MGQDLLLSPMVSRPGGWIAKAVTPCRLASTATCSVYLITAASETAYADLTRTVRTRRIVDEDVCRTEHALHVPERPLDRRGSVTSTDQAPARTPALRISSTVLATRRRV